jgi:hypothetical protein
MSCGYADEEAAVNRLNMPREPLDGFTRWLGFDEQAIDVRSWHEPDIRACPLKCR